MKIILIFLFIGFTNFASANILEDVKLLDLKYVKGGFEIKLQDKKQSEKNAHFIVRIIQDDDKAFEKISIVLKKQKLKDAFKLNLDILSFSAFPSGAFYLSTSVKFLGTSEDESLICK